MATSRETEGVPPDLVTVGFDAVGHCLESWLRPRQQDLTRPLPPDVRQAIAEETAASVKERLASLAQADHLAAAGTAIEGMLYMFMDLFETWRTVEGSASSGIFPGESLN